MSDLDPLATKLPKPHAGQFLKVVEDLDALGPDDECAKITLYSKDRWSVLGARGRASLWARLDKASPVEVFEFDLYKHRDQMIDFFKRLAGLGLGSGSIAIAGSDDSFPARIRLRFMAGLYAPPSAEERAKACLEVVNIYIPQYFPSSNNMLCIQASTNEEWTFVVGSGTFSLWARTKTPKDEPTYVDLSTPAARVHLRELAGAEEEMWCGCDDVVFEFMEGIHHQPQPLELRIK
jgi:hypothetical protein